MSDMQSAVQDLITRVTALEKYVAETEHVWATCVERIEALEPPTGGTSSTDVALRREQIARLGPFRVSTNDKDSILTHDGRVFLAVYTSGDRDLVLLALNDVWSVERLGP